MKKLLIATDSFLPRWDGISRFLSEIMPVLENEFEITVVCPKYKGDLKGFEKIHIVRFRTLGLSIADINLAWPNLKRLRDLVAEADLVWTQTLGPIGALTVLNAKKLNRPCLAYIHSIEWELFSKSVRSMRDLVFILTTFYVRWLYNRCSMLMVPSLEVEELLQYNGIRTQKKVVHLGIDIDKFRPADIKSDAKKKVGINPDHKVIGYTGRIAREKDVLTLYKAFLKVKQERKDVVLLIVGDGLSSYKKIMSENDSVIMPGSVNNIQDYLQAMDIFVLPSLTETTSLSTMEAMSCGIPVISTKVGFVKRYVKEKENGMFFPQHNDLLLSLKIKWLLERPDMMYHLSENARKTITDRYQWKSTVERIKTILTSVETRPAP